jgi:hypothetical protein
MPSLPIRSLSDANHGEWFRMRQALWPEESSPNSGKACEYLAGVRAGDAAVFVASRTEACSAASSRVGSGVLRRRGVSPRAGGVCPELESIHVRLPGTGRARSAAAEVWARGRGYQEIAWDRRSEEPGSHRAHPALRFSKPTASWFSKASTPGAQPRLSLEGIDHVALAVRGSPRRCSGRGRVGLKAGRTAWGDTRLSSLAPPPGAFPVEAARSFRPVRMFGHAHVAFPYPELRPAREALARRRIDIACPTSWDLESIYFHLTWARAQITTYDLKGTA